MRGTTFECGQGRCFDALPLVISVNPIMFGGLGLDNVAKPTRLNACR